jgi:hypothetical protein
VWQFQDLVLMARQWGAQDASLRDGPLPPPRKVVKRRRRHQHGRARRSLITYDGATVITPSEIQAWYNVPQASGIVTPVQGVAEFAEQVFLKSDLVTAYRTLGSSKISPDYYPVGCRGAGQDRIYSWLYQSSSLCEDLWPITLPLERRALSLCLSVVLMWSGLWLRW